MTRYAFPRFLDLDERACNIDLHVHTNRTDGLHTIDNILDCAVERGLSTIAFTEHVRQSTPWFDAFAAEIRTAAARRADLRVLVGCEAKALGVEGEILDASPATLAACDIVLGSVHRFPDGAGGLLNFADLDAQTTARMETELALALARSAPIDVLAHPGGMYQRRHGPFPFELMGQLMEATLARGIAIEISSSYLRDFDGFMRLCAEINPYVSVGSDVHKLDDVGTCRDRVRSYLALT